NTFKFTVTQTTTSAVDFSFFVMAWDTGTSRATGGILYQSGVFITPGQSVAFDVNVSPNVSLTSGNVYVAFINNSALQASGPSGGLLQMASRSDDAYAGGSFVFQNSGTNFGSVTSTAWSVGFTTAADTAFHADFS